MTPGTRRVRARLYAAVTITLLTFGCIVVLVGSAEGTPVHKLAFLVGLLGTSLVWGWFEWQLELAKRDADAPDKTLDQR